MARTVSANCLLQCLENTVVHCCEMCCCVTCVADSHDQGAVLCGNEWPHCVNRVERCDVVRLPSDGGLDPSVSMTVRAAQPLRVTMCMLSGLYPFAAGTLAFLCCVVLFVLCARNVCGDHRPAVGKIESCSSSPHSVRTRLS